MPKTYLEFQNEVKGLTREILKKRLRMTHQLSSEIAELIAQEVAYKVHHEIWPLDPEKDFQWGRDYVGPNPPNEED